MGDTETGRTAGASTWTGDLDDGEREVILAIARATWRWNGDTRATPCAWKRAADLDPFHLASCVSKGLVSLWEANRAGAGFVAGTLAVLTPYGAYRAQTVMTERWRYHAVTEKKSRDDMERQRSRRGRDKDERPRAGAGAGSTVKPTVKVRVAEENPYFKRVEPDKNGKLPLVHRTIRLPRRAREVELACPELVPDPAPGPEYLTDDEGEPVNLFGLPVPISTKPLKGKR